MTSRTQISSAAPEGYRKVSTLDGHAAGRALAALGLHSHKHQTERMDATQFAETSLDAAETQFLHVLRTNDTTALDGLLHEQTRFVGPDGMTIDKATDIELHRSGQLVMTTVEELERDVQVIDGVGITRATLHVVGSAGGHAFDAVMAYTRVWVASADGWLIIAAHGSAGAAAAG